MSKLTRFLIEVYSIFIAIIIACTIGFVVTMITPPYGHLPGYTKEVHKVTYEEAFGPVEGFILVYKNIETGEIGFGNTYPDSKSAVRNLKRITEKGAHRKGNSFIYKL